VSIPTAYSLPCPNVDAKVDPKTGTETFTAPGGSSLAGSTSAQLTSAIGTAAAAAAGTWQKDTKGWKYNYTAGGNPAGTQVTDTLGNATERLNWAKIGGADFAFGSDGYMKTGWVCDGTDGTWYYCDENRGKIGGWYQNADKNWY
jgi:glucan-binding YG repeat protein